MSLVVNILKVRGLPTNSGDNLNSTESSSPRLLVRVKKAIHLIPWTYLVLVSTA